MNLIKCRDCGQMLSADARGCSRCAMNLEAERMLGRFLWRIVAPVVIILVIATLATVYIRR